MSTHSVHVSGIAPTTTQVQLNDFFTFCGHIESIDFEKSTATIHFSKSSAAKTALMLNGGTLDGAHITVTSDVAHQDEPVEYKEGVPIDQTDKPRAGIVAEYLAKGYQLSDDILNRAIKLDEERGITKRFLGWWHSFDTSVGARALGPDQTLSSKVQSTVVSGTQQAKAFDEQKGISKTATEYYTKALGTPVGQKVREFYTSTQKQVLDIHEEAKRIKAQSKPSGEPTTETKSAETVPAVTPVNA